MYSSSASQPELYQEQTSSLWRCEFCDILVSIHSPHMIAHANCPSCTGSHLTYCGDFELILGLTPADA
jgi:hypothetical protein